MQLFLDSSVILAAIGSQTGGSSHLYFLKLSKKLKLVTSRLVICEVEKNVRKKFSEMYLERFLMLSSQMIMLPDYPNEKIIKLAEAVIVAKDAPMLADAKSSKSNILVTLDKKDMLKPKVCKFMDPIKIMTPGEVIKLVESRPLQTIGSRL